MPVKKTITQCKSCPWKTDCVPERDIPNYQVALHCSLTNTIASGEASLRSVLAGGGLRIMACHYSKPPEEFPCAGWLNQQLGTGNNIGLRLLVAYGRIPAPVVEGEQHETLEDTIPRSAPKRRRKR